jgi:plastocyanin
MRRALVAILTVAAIGVGVAAASGAFSSASPSPAAHKASVAAAQQAPMPPMPPMPTGAAAAAEHAPPSVQLHRSVVHVEIKNFAFLPAHVVISPGTRVVWTNTDEEPHTVVSDKPGWSSEALETGSHYAFVMSRPGTFTYHCSIHPFMHGTVVVES